MIYDFIHIDWPHYFETLAILVVLYWLVVAVIYFRREVKDFLRGKKRNSGHPMNIDSPFKESEDAEQTSLFDDEREEQEEGNATSVREDRFPLLYSMADEIRDLILQAGESGMVRGELIGALQSLIGKEQYLSLNDAQYRVAINNLVAVEAEQQCGIHFDADELNQLWKTEKP